jgi:uncharacterized protein YndB with AHSA1/START domain
MHRWLISNNLRQSIKILHLYMPNNKDTAGRELKISRLLKANIDLVWEAWINPDHIQHWWGPKDMTTTIKKMDVQTGGEWLCTIHAPDGKKFPNKSIYREIITHRKLVFEHFNPGYVATIIFEPKGK